MAVTEVLRALGSWGVTLSPEIPREVWDKITYFGHIAIHAGPVDVRVAGDSALTSARYVGVVRGISNDDTYRLSGPGLAMWLGDEDGKGPVIENLLTITTQTLENATRLIVPPASSALLEGTYFNMPGNPLFTGTFQWQTQREALNYLTDTLGAEWRVRGAGLLDVGPASSLFVTTPTTIVARKLTGRDMSLNGFPGALGTSRDVNDFTTRVVLLRDDGSGGTASASADILIGLNPYKDLHGATLRMTRLVSETTTDDTNAAARAQLQLNRFTSTRNALTLSTDAYDVKGDAAVGDYLWVHDPDLGITDPANEVRFRGAVLTPMKLRLTEMTWPIVAGMTVAYRNAVGGWYDLTPYLIPETGETTLVVGGFNKTLSDGSDGGGGVRPQPQPNLTIPAAPTWITPFLQGTYQSALTGETKSQAQLTWTLPVNTDGSVVTDLDYYEVRYRSASTPLFPVTHAQMAVYTHAQLAANGGTFGQPIHYATGDWQYTRVPAGQLSAMVYELTPAMPYEAQVRAVDNAVPANAGAWSSLTSWQTLDDTIAPATPAAPEVAASLIAIQITHRLGRSDGGTFNLDRDLHHFEVHGSSAPTFTPVGDTVGTGTLLGRLTANWGMIVGQIPVVGKIQVSSVVPIYFKVIAVDNSGNKSTPSPYAVSTALLIDDAHISDLTVSKVTAGTISASWIMAGEIRTGLVYPLVIMDVDGVRAYDAAGVRTVNIQASDGSVDIIGSLRSGASNKRIEINPPSQGVPEVWFYGTSGTRHAYINAIDNGADYVTLGLNSGEHTSQAQIQSSLLLTPDWAQLARNTFTNAIRGGYLQQFQNDTYLGCRDDGSGADAYVHIEKTGKITFDGFFGKQATLGGAGALYIDQVGGSGTSASVSYGATFATTPLPFIEIQGTSGSPPTASNHAVTARSTTGFSIQYPAGNCDIFIWAIRYG